MSMILYVHKGYVKWTLVLRFLFSVYAVTHSLWAITICKKDFGEL